jgi:hypothetical protein
MRPLSPPLVPAIARAARALFGESLVGLRLFSALAQSAAIGPFALIQGVMFPDVFLCRGVRKPWPDL